MPPLPEGGGGILFYLCLSVHQSFRPSFHPSKIFFVFNVYKNQLSRQTGSRNLTGPKTLPTIWYTYMMLVTKYQISAINSYYICTFFSATIDDRDLIFGHKRHIGTPYRSKRFWTHQIPTSCLPT
jgi:hypothetical protein